MEFIETPLAGCFLIETAPVRDARGWFVRTFCAREFAARGLNAALAQSSLSFNRWRGTLRGLHFQAAPAMEDKLVRCDRGAVFDVAVDLRPGSQTFGRWHGVELTQENGRQLYIPRGFAHGARRSPTTSCGLPHRKSSTGHGGGEPGVWTIGDSRGVALPRRESPRTRDDSRKLSNPPYWAHLRRCRHIARYQPPQMGSRRIRRCQHCATPNHARLLA